MRPHKYAERPRRSTGAGRAPGAPLRAQVVRDRLQHLVAHVREVGEHRAEGRSRGALELVVGEETEGGGVGPGRLRAIDHVAWTAAGREPDTRRDGRSGSAGPPVVERAEDGAQERIRTSTVLRPPDPESGASTSSATWAR